MFGHILQSGFMSIRIELLGELDSQAEAVKVEVCVSLPETVTCVAFTPEKRRSTSLH